MVNSTQASPAEAASTPHAACYDLSDMENFINYDQLIYPSPSLSPSSSQSQAGRPLTTADQNNTLLPPNPSGNQNTFSRPSHQYDMHKQQTGIPAGALAETLAINQASNMQFVRNAAMASNDSFFGSSSDGEIIDFGAPIHNASFSGASDIEMEYESSSQDGLPAFFYPQRSVSSTSEYVNPSVIGGQEEPSPLSGSTSAVSNQSNVGRLWPGMHQQQAAIAKAQAHALQQKHQQQIPQQQQFQRQITAQQSRAQPQSRLPSYQPTEAMVEEKISQLLSSMRQSSVTSSADDDDDASTPNANGVHSHIARMRKEEEDMDEDERLLASEEGKKLSSKERRQLRNKVSARAFRSRRKEYIGQLEGEVAIKTNEANDLRAQNQALMAENTRLSDLTRMLLSSPAFSTFLNDLSTNGMPPASSSEQATSAVSAPTQPNTHKDVNQYQVAQQQKQASQQDGLQVGMALMPDNFSSLSTLDANNGGWATGVTGWASNQPQVFSVLELPEGPAVDQIDAGVLSGKSSDINGIQSFIQETKNDAPVIECMPQSEEVIKESVAEEKSSDIDLDSSDPSFALYFDSPSPVTSAPVQQEAEPFSGIPSAKLFSRFDLVSASDMDCDEAGVSAATMARFERLCAGIEAASQRVDRATSHI